jgi:large subunit ribosomal protein L29
MKASEIRALTNEEIRTKLNDAREELMNLRFQQATGELTDFTRLRATRRTIARFNTIVRQRELEAQREGEE